MVHYPNPKWSGSYVITPDDWNALIDALTSELASQGA